MVILLTGSDLYRSHQRLHQLRQAFINKFDPQGFNTVTLSGGNLTLPDLRTAVTTGGLFTSRRFVAIDDYTTSADLAAEDVRAILAPLVADEKVIAVVRLTAAPKRSGRPSRAKKPAAAKAGLTVPKAKVEEFSRLGEAQLVTWITAEAKQRGGAIARLAAERLALFCQGDTWRVSSELDKLLAYAGKDTISLEAVQSMVSSPFESNIFALTDAVGQRNNAQAVALLHRELQAGTHPLILVATLASHIRNLLIIQTAGAGQSSSAVIAKKTKLHPYVVQKSIAQAQRFSADELKTWHHRLAEMDIKLKSTPLEAEALFDLLILART